MWYCITFVTMTNNWWYIGCNATTYQIDSVWRGRPECCFHLHGRKPCSSWWNQFIIDNIVATTQYCPTLHGTTQCCNNVNWHCYNAILQVHRMTASEPAGPGCRARPASYNHWSRPLCPRAAMGDTNHGMRCSTTWNIPHIPCIWGPLGGQAWYFSHNFGPRPIQPTKHCVGSSSGLDGSIKLSSIPPIQVSSWRSLQPPQATPRPGPYLPIDLITFPNVNQYLLWALIQALVSQGCHGWHKPWRKALRLYNLKYTPHTMYLGPTGREGMVFQS